MAQQDGGMNSCTRSSSAAITALPSLQHLADRVDSWNLCMSPVVNDLVLRSQAVEGR